MTHKAEQGKWTIEQIKEHVRRIAKVVEQHKRQHEYEHFTSVTPEEIEKKLKRVNSPMIVSQGWGGATPGGTVHYGLQVYNPDPVDFPWLFAHVYVGSGNVDPTVGTFLLNVDTRFPRLTQPAATGLTLAPGAAAKLSFDLPVPSTIEKTNYIGNTCLFQLNWHDVGLYLDRGVFVFAVS